MDADESTHDYILKLEEATRAMKTLQEQSDTFLSLMQTIDGFTEVGSIEEALSLYTPGIAYTRTYYAPVSGTILECSLGVGFVAQTVSPAMVLSDQASGMLLTLVIDSNDAGEMAVGDTVQISVGSERYNSVVSSIVNSVKTPGKASIEITLPEESGAPGMNAEMLFTKRTQNYDVIVPLSALRHDNSGDFIFIVRQEGGSLGVKLSVRRVDAYVLDQSSGRVALQSDITQRDLIVVRSDRSLTDGDRIRISEGL